MSHILPRERDRRVYVFISAIDATGGGLFMPISVLYLTQVVGLGAAEAGLGIAISGGAALAATFMLGSITDRFEARRLARVGFVLSGCGYFALAGVRSFATYLVVGSFIGIADALARAARKMLVVGMAGAEGRVELFAYERSTRNVGYAIGGLLASAALAAGSHLAFVLVILVNAVSYLVGAFAMRLLPKIFPTSRAARGGSYRVVFRNRPYLALTAISGVLWTNDTVLKVGMALWIIDRTQAPAFLVGVLFTVNTILVVALQVRASRGAGSIVGASNAYRRTGAALALACGLFAAAAGVSAILAAALLIAAVSTLTIGELYLSAADWTASVELAEDRARGRYLAFYSLGSGLQATLGPVVVAFAIASGGRWAWVGLAIVFSVAAASARTLTLRSARRRDLLASEVLRRAA